MDLIQQYEARERQASSPEALKADFSKQAKESGKAALSPGEEDSFSFTDVLNIINPLHHLPVISTLYQHMTGDRATGVPNAIGDLLYGGLLGGPIGVATSAANLALEGATGKDLGDHVYAMLEGESSAGQVADKAVAKPDEKPFEPPPAGGLAVAPVTSENLAALPGTQLASAAAQPAAAESVSLWAKQAIGERQEDKVAMVGAEETEDPVTLWARQENRIRAALAGKDTPPATPDPLAAEKTLRDPRQAAALGPDSGVLAALRLAQQDLDAGQAAWRQTEDSAREGREGDRAAEHQAGEPLSRQAATLFDTVAATLGRYRDGERLAQAVEPTFATQG